MKDALKKISEVCKLIFGYGIMITLLVGALTFFGYVAALIIGGDVAASICNVIYKNVIPVMIYASSALVLFGLVAMYLAGESALTADKKKKASREGEK